MNSVVSGRIKLDSSVYTAPFPKACDCTKCGSACCEAGAIITLEERDRILQVKDELIPLLEPDRRNPQNWFTPPDDEDFTRLGEEASPEKKAKFVGTGTGKDFCNFFNPEFGCALQELSVRKGGHKWGLKPESCILYPLYRDESGVIRPDETLDVSMWCKKAENLESTVFAACQEEIKYVQDLQAPRQSRAPVP